MSIFFGACWCDFVANLEAVIQDYLDRHNANPKPFVWTKIATTILSKERRAFAALLAEWTTEHGQITKIRLSDVSGGRPIPTAAQSEYYRHRFEGHLGNVG